MYIDLGVPTSEIGIRQNTPTIRYRSSEPKRDYKTSDLNPYLTSGRGASVISEAPVSAYEVNHSYGYQYFVTINANDHANRADFGQLEMSPKILVNPKIQQALPKLIESKASRGKLSRGYLKLQKYIYLQQKYQISKRQKLYSRIIVESSFSRCLPLSNDCKSFKNCVRRNVEDYLKTQTYLCEICSELILQYILDKNHSCSISRYDNIVNSKYYKNNFYKNKYQCINYSKAFFFTVELDQNVNNIDIATKSKCLSAKTTNTGCYSDVNSSTAIPCGNRSSLPTSIIFPTCSTSFKKCSCSSSHSRKHCKSSTTSSSIPPIYPTLTSSSSSSSRKRGRSSTTSSTIPPIYPTLTSSSSSHSRRRCRSSTTSSTIPPIYPTLTSS
ncbi:hypothetical protein AYI68_g477, partial [Smittium mucronatum]